MKRAYALLHSFEGWILAIAILTMAVATIANVIARNVIGDSLAATEELNKFLIVLVCFVGLSYGAGEGRHIRMTALGDVLPPRGRVVLMSIVTAGTAALLFVMAWFAVRYLPFVDRRSPVLGVSMRLVYSIAPIGLFMGGVQYALAAYRNITGGHADITFAPDLVQDVGEEFIDLPDQESEAALEAPGERAEADR